MAASLKVPWFCSTLTPPHPYPSYPPTPPPFTLQQDCEHEGRKYEPGESFQPGADPCEVCVCEVGEGTVEGQPGHCGEQALWGQGQACVPEARE